VSERDAARRRGEAWQQAREKQKEEEEKKAREFDAVEIVWEVISKLRLVTPESFDALRDELESVQQAQYQAMGSQATNVEQDVEKALASAEIKVQDILKQREEERIRKEEEERLRINGSAGIIPTFASSAEEVVEAEKEFVDDASKCVGDQRRTGLAQKASMLASKTAGAGSGVLRQFSRWIQDVQNGQTGQNRAASPDGPSDDDLGEPVIIFDWDDTLFPSWFVKNVILQQAKDSFADPMSEHTLAVMDVLRAARQVARVGIVTLAGKSWIQTTLREYLSTNGGSQSLEALMVELEIEFFHADLPETITPGEPPGVTAKKAAMNGCINKLHGGGAWHIISIGDSVCERDALKEVMKSSPQIHSLCKTIKLSENPWLTELTEDLRKLVPSMQPLCAYPEDCDCIGPDF